VTDDVWLDTVRIARDLGTVQDLLPEGITNLADCPYNIHDAITKALLFLSFSEELEEKERPPKRIWLDPPRLKKWFEEVKLKREEKWGVDGKKEIEDPVENPAAKHLIVGD
jgi:hypothetical protein